MPRSAAALFSYSAPPALVFRLAGSGQISPLPLGLSWSARYADGSSKDHSARTLAKKHLSFWTTRAHVKAISQVRTAIRNEQTDTAALCGDAAKRIAFLEKFRVAWDKCFPKKTLSDGDMAFAADMLAYTA